MKLQKRGKNTLISVEEITPFGIWLNVKTKEYFLSYDVFPYFQNQQNNKVKNVKLYHDFCLHWPQLDIDLELDNLEHPEKYPLVFNYDVDKISLKNHKAKKKHRDIGHGDKQKTSNIIYKRKIESTRNITVSESHKILSKDKPFILK